MSNKKNRMRYIYDFTQTHALSGRKYIDIRIPTASIHNPTFAMLIILVRLFYKIVQNMAFEHCPVAPI